MPTFEEDVFPRELGEIQARRRRLGLTGLDGIDAPSSAAQREALSLIQRVRRFFSKAVPEKKPASQIPSTRHGLVGLALSGGGIRSASFCLGVLQILAERGILKRVDYLSTVSGGGYIGSCVSAVMTEPSTAGTRPLEFPFRHEAGVREPAAFKHLRNHASYLAEKGLLSWMRIPGLLLRGVVSNLLVIVPWLALAALATDQLVGTDLLVNRKPWSPAPESFEKYPWSAAFTAAPWRYMGLAVYPVAAWLFYVVVAPIGMAVGHPGNWRRRDLYQKSFGALLLAVAVSVVVLAQPVAIELFARIALHDGALTDGYLWTALGGTLLPFLAGRSAAEASSRWTGRLGLWALGLIGPAILWVLYLRLSAWVIYGGEDWAALLGFPPDGPTIVGLALGVILVTTVFTDVNRSSLHNFYRDRLSRAFIWRIPKKGESPQPADELKLSDLNPRDSTAPYHLINAALNLQASRDADLRDRQSDFFVFSKHFVGSERGNVGFCPTLEIEDADRHLDLATAMSISGAGVSPNMGTHTIRPATFVLALLNLRLGYWLPHPVTVNQGRDENAFVRLLGIGKRRLGLTRVGPIYLLREMFGLVSAERSNLNVSDGGHLENLGLYQLLRRRCKYIVVCDGEADPELAFGSLARVMRYARTDLATEIDIDLDGLRLDENGRSRRQCAIGEIEYPDGELGHIVYVKAAVGGDEVEYVREYRKNHPAFPHESTADQFFDEAQFEAYRALGYHSHRDLFPPRRGNETDWGDPAATLSIPGWFEYLDRTLRMSPLADGRRRTLDGHLLDIEMKLACPELWPYRQEIYPRLPEDTDHPAAPTDGSDPEPGERLFRHAFHVCQMQMRALEEARQVLDLESAAARRLPSNRGYMNLFRRWSHAPTFRRAWALTIGNYDSAFQLFCEYILGLRATLVWNAAPDPNDRSPLEHRELAALLVAAPTPQRPVVVDERTLNAHQIWHAEIEMELHSDGLMERFPVGVASIALGRSSRGELIAGLRYYRVRDEYRRMGLLPRMIEALPARLRREFGARVSVVVDPPPPLDASVRRNADLFARAGIGMP